MIDVGDTEREACALRARVLLVRMGRLSLDLRDAERHEAADAVLRRRDHLRRVAAAALTEVEA